MRGMRALSLLPFVAAFAFGCPTPIGEPALPCTNAHDCSPGQVCTAGACVAGATGSCTIDTECDVNTGQICDPLTHTCKDGGNTSTTCSNTSECPNLTQFCNTATGQCVDLAPGFCRNSSQCSADTAVCSAASENVPGRCVQCLTNADCGGANCVQPGVCSTVVCRANATAINGTCHCNPTFHDDGTGSCVCAAGFHVGTAAPGNPAQCVANGGGGEGEGEGGGGEGEGQAPSCNPQLAGLDCTLGGGPFNNCAAGPPPVCECNGFILLIGCVLGGGNPDQASCSCAGEGEGEGEGGGGEGEGEGGAVDKANGNTPCDVDADCGAGEACLSDGSTTVRGSCKQTCAANGDCAAGVACQVNALGPGQGYCANQSAEGGPCGGSFASGSWRAVDTFCADPNATAQSTPLLCVSGTCHFVCDSEFNTGAKLPCPGGETCGAVNKTSNDVNLFPDTSPTQVATCN